MIFCFSIAKFQTVSEWIEYIHIRWVSISRWSLGECKFCIKIVPKGNPCPVYTTKKQNMFEWNFGTRSDQYLVHPSNREKKSIGKNSSITKVGPIYWLEYNQKGLGGQGRNWKVGRHVPT